MAMQQKYLVCRFLRDNNKAYFTHYYYKRLFDQDKPGETFTILLTKRDMNVV